MYKTLDEGSLVEEEAKRRGRPIIGNQMRTMEEVRTISRWRLDMTMVNGNFFDGQTLVLVGIFFVARGNCMTDSLYITHVSNKLRLLEQLILPTSFLICMFGLQMVSVPIQEGIRHWRISW